jgi:DNA polymerase-3 subunit alpha (Gram-positive type)
MVRGSDLIEDTYFVVIDTETTGTDLWRDKIVEVGAVKICNFQVISEFSSLVRTRRRIHPAAFKVHRISKDQLRVAPEFTDVKTHLLKFLKNSVVVDHSQNRFDVTLLENALGHKIRNPYISTLTLSKKLYPKYEEHSLDAILERRGIHRARPHWALLDAEAEAEILIRQLEKLLKKGVRTVKDLQSFLAPITE